MKKMIVLNFLARACLGSGSLVHPLSASDPVYIPPSAQRSGDTSEGYHYLVTGDYLKSGIPYSYFKLGFGQTSHSLLKRGGLNDKVGYEYTVVKAPNGEEVVAPNCLQCHAQTFEGKLYIGLGNTMIDFSNNDKLDPKVAAYAEQVMSRVDPKKYDAAEPFLKVVKTIGGQFARFEARNCISKLMMYVCVHIYVICM